MYKVFFNDRIVFLAGIEQNQLPTDGCIAVHPLTLAETTVAVQRFFDNGWSGDLCFFHHDPDLLLKWFCSCFVNIDAAGGIVSNDRNELLCIFRNGRWDLPKGKVEKGEPIAAAALREVEEECGINGLRLGELATNTYHIYPHPSKKGKWVLKKTYWYFMQYNGNQILKPQKEEQIEEAVWMNAFQIGTAKQNTFASLMPLFDLWINFSTHSG
jgi:ADP-ribose pyrophosphatase YjhB (NUDIX family)